MVGASINHNRIVGNVYFNLRVAFKEKDYTLFATNLRLWVPLRNAYTYPDIMVIAGTPLRHNERNDTVTNPFMLVEVLSESTSTYDRGEKFIGYRTIPTLRDYLLIDQSRCLVEQFSRVEHSKWLLIEYSDMEQVMILSFEPVQLALHDIYKGVEWPAAPEQHPTNTAQNASEQSEDRTIT
jgi:Uma2 family endonuclease